MVRARKPRLGDGPSTGYGDEAALLASDAQVPSRPFISPDEVPNLSDPTARPDEPLTAGLPMGAGPGPEALGPMAEVDPVRRLLRAMLVAYPNNDVMRMIDFLDVQGR